MVGDVGYITASIKTVQDTRVGDTITLANNPASEPLEGISPNESYGLLWVISNRYFAL